MPSNAPTISRFFADNPGSFQRADAYLAGLEEALVEPYASRRLVHVGRLPKFPTILGQVTTWEPIVDYEYPQGFTIHDNIQFREVMLAIHRRILPLHTLPSMGTASTANRLAWYAHATGQFGIDAETAHLADRIATMAVNQSLGVHVTIHSVNPAFDPRIENNRPAYVEEGTIW